MKKLITSKTYLIVSILFCSDTFKRSCRHPRSTCLLRFQQNSSYSQKKNGRIKNIEGDGEQQNTERENGKYRDLSVIGMHTDKPTLWIMFLSLSALIIVFLVKTNPLISVRLQSAGMFIANSWKKHIKERVSRQASKLHLYHCHLLWVAHGVENPEQKTERSRVIEVKNVHQRERKKKKKIVLNTPHQVVPVRTHCHPLIGSFLIPLPHDASPLMGECQGAKSLRGLTGTESKQAPTLPADNLASPSTHRRKNIQKHGPIAPVCTTGA